MLPFNFREKPGCMQYVQDELIRTPLMSKKYDQIAETFDATSWFAQAIEECNELAAAIGKLNRTLNAGLPTPVDFETAYDNVIEELADAVDTLETAMVVLKKQWPDVHTGRASVAISGPLSKEDRDYMAVVIKLYKHNRFVERNSDRLNMKLGGMDH